MKKIKDKSYIIGAQPVAGHESGSGFCDAFSRMMGNVSSRGEDIRVLKATWMDTPLGSMIAIADNEALYLLEFIERKGLEKEIKKLRTTFAIIPGKTDPLFSIEKELVQYFKGEKIQFKTPFKMLGTPFQKRVWEELLTIPRGKTCSYADIAKLIGMPTAYRAVANANGANQLAVIIPCHRVINSNGELGGYGGGIARKKWLLNLEAKNG